jgi:P-type Mg2+ transporter
MTSAAAPAGLSSEAAEVVLRQVGPNELVRRRGGSALSQLIVSFASPLLGVLLAAAIASAYLGQVVDAVLITSMVILSGTIDFAQTVRSTRAVERLRSRVAATATAMRDGCWVEVPRRAIVPGDRIRLTAGDLVPADARLVEVNCLHAIESALTGESLPVEKEVAPVELPDEGPSPGWVYTGTSVASGTGEGIVARTGGRTRFGEIAARLAEHPQPTAFELGIRDFGLFLTRTILFLVVFIVVVSLAMHRPPLQSVLFAVALAVGLTPEFLPLISTVTLGESAMRLAKARVIVKRLSAIQNLGSIDILCSDKTGTLTQGRARLDSAVAGDGQPSPVVLARAARNSAFQQGLPNPLDRAILDASPAAGMGCRRLDEVPFDFDRRRVSVLVDEGGVRELVTKGAPESVLETCSTWEQGGSRHPLDEPARARCAQTLDSLTARGLRVLAVATRTLGAGESCSVATEQEACLLGFLTFEDPPLPGATAAIEALERDGVEVKVITGDDAAVTRDVCQRLGLDVIEVVLGKDLERLTDPALEALAERASVFARVSPPQKTRILSALRRRGHVVGFMGDGINDAPSLRAADVGISVAGAVDVAREAADIILLEPGLGVLHAAIVGGRRAFGNVMKYVLMGTSSNFGNMLSMAGATLFLPFLPMLPTQILLNNFLYDLAQLAIPTDAVDSSYLRQPQRWDIRRVRRFMLLVGPISSLWDFLTFWILLAVFHASETRFHTGWFLESLATQTLVVFVIRTAGPFWKSRASLALTLDIVAVLSLAMLLPWTAFGAELGFEPLPFSFFLFLTLATLSYLLLVELAKTRLLPGFEATSRSKPDAPRLSERAA